MHFFLAAEIISIVAFLFYGSSCIATKKMILEFERYKLSRFRILTGTLQILGSLGLIAGFFIPGLTAFSSLGLATLMFMGVIVRVSIGDSIKETSPAIIFCILNAYILLMTVRGS